MIKRKKLAALLLTIFIGLIFFKKTVYSVNRLINPGFEEGTLFWHPQNSNVNLTIISNDVVEGTRSALIENLSSSSYGIEQTITNIKNNFNYRIAASIKLQDDQTTAFFRVAWYESDDGSGRQLSTSDSNSASSHQEWQRIEMVEKSPDNAASAKLRLLIKNGKAYFDDIVFDEEYISSTFTPTPTSSSSITNVFSSTPTVGFNLTPTPTSVFLSYDNIYLSEVMVNPVTGEKEWVEIYNDNDFLVELKNWFIDDGENAGSTPKNFNITLDKKSYRVIEFPSAIFNNNGDQVRLLDFNKIEKDSFEYLSSQIGKSYGRTSFDFDEWCQQEPSKGQKNNPCSANPTQVDSFSTGSFISQPTNLSPTSSSKNKSNFSPNQAVNNYKSFQPKFQVSTSEKNLAPGEVLGEEIEKNNKKEDILFLPILQSLLTSFLFLKKILKSIKIN